MGIERNGKVLISLNGSETLTVPLTICLLLLRKKYLEKRNAVLIDHVCLQTMSHLRVSFSVSISSSISSLIQLLWYLHTIISVGQTVINIS